jgi:hypothetical protein
MAEWWEDVFGPERKVAEAAGGIIGGIFGSRGASGAAAEPEPTRVSTAEEDNDRYVRETRDRANREAFERSTAQSAGLPDPFGENYGQPSAEDAARAGLLSVQKANAELQRDKLAEEIRQANSPEAKAALDLQLKVASANLRKLDLEYEKALKEMSPEAQIRLTDELATKRERLKAELEEAQSTRDYDRIIHREELAATRLAAREDARDTRTFAHENARDTRNIAAQSARDDKQFGRDLQRDQMSLGVSVRGQELERLKAQDDFVMNVFQSQVKSGELSLAKAAKQFEAYVTKARLPSEIMANVGRAVEPLLPYMSPYKKGDIPMGFETGGSRDIIGRLGGNAPGSYNPSTYAANPVQVDPFKLAKQAGADFSQTSVPDPGKAFGGVNIPAPISGGSATAGIGPISQYTGQIAQQQGTMGMSAAPMPPGVSMSPEEQQSVIQALGG